MNLYSAGHFIPGRPGETATPDIRQHARIHTFLHSIAVITVLLSFLIAGIDATPAAVRGGPPPAPDPCCHKLLQRRKTITTITTTIHTTKTIHTTVATIHSSRSTITHSQTPQTPLTSNSMTSTSSTLPVPLRPSSTWVSTGGQKTSMGSSPTTSSSVISTDLGTPIPSNSPSNGGPQSSSYPTKSLSWAAIAGIATGGIAMILGLALVTYEVRRRRINKARKEELVAHPADLHRPENPDSSASPPPVKQPFSSKAAPVRIADSFAEYPPLSPISFVAQEGDNLSLLAAHGTLASMSRAGTPQPQSVPPHAERWQVRPLSLLPKPERRKSPLIMSPLSAPAIARRVSPFLTRAVRPRQVAQGPLSGSSAAGSPNSESRSAPATSSPSRQGRSPRVASDGGVRLAGGPPGDGTRYERMDGASRGLPPPYGMMG